VLVSQLFESDRDAVPLLVVIPGKTPRQSFLPRRIVGGLLFPLLGGNLPDCVANIFVFGIYGRARSGVFPLRPSPRLGRQLLNFVVIVTGGADSDHRDDRFVAEQEFPIV